MERPLSAHFYYWTMPGLRYFHPHRRAAALVSIHTAASGLVHEEFHAPDFARRGGKFEMVQLWVNLPAKNKMAAPHYQGIKSDRIPVVELPGGCGKLRVIAGEFLGVIGPAKTFTPIQVWDIRLTGNSSTELAVNEGHTTLLVVLKGAVRVNGSQMIGEAEFGRFEQTGQYFGVECEQDAVVLLLSGEPIDEPIVGQGPFVMNSHQEIRQAIADYQSGKMGHLQSSY